MASSKDAAVFNVSWSGGYGNTESANFETQEEVNKFLILNADKFRFEQPTIKNVLTNTEYEVYWQVFVMPPFPLRER